MDFEPIAQGITQMITDFGGASFRSGLYRLHSFGSMLKWTDIATEAFPEFQNHIYCFGYDWLGRQFAVDCRKISDGQTQIVLLDIGFGEALVIPTSFLVFHDIELVDYSADALAEPFYNEWLAAGGAQPLSHECIGYRVSPFLGGKDEVHNLELTDMEVYWGIAGQIRARIPK